MPRIVNSRKWPWRLAATIAQAALMSLGACTAAHAECRMEPAGRATVVRAVDGETLRLDDGREVRLAGVVAPRGYDAGVADAEWPAAEAARKALAAVSEGQTVVLGTTSQVRSDRLGRLIAQVFVLKARDTASAAATAPAVASEVTDRDAAAQEIWVQGQMLIQGHARAAQQRDVRGCLDELLAHERPARAAARGLWGIAAYRVREAARLRDQAGLSGRFAIVRGRVAWVADGRTVTALGFTPDATRTRWQARRGLVALIEAHDRDLLGSFGGDAKSLQGRQVELRGWVEERLGRPQGALVVDVSVAGWLTVVDPPASVATATPAAAAQPE